MPLPLPTRLAMSVPSAKGSRKGYVPMVLVGGEEGGEQRVLVHVKMLKEPRVLALLDMSEQLFGYNQQGVLRIPCGLQRFEQTIRDRREMQDCKIMREQHTS